MAYHVMYVVARGRSLQTTKDGVEEDMWTCVSYDAKRRKSLLWLQLKDMHNGAMLNRRSD